ncbi:hypothetical protein JA1_001310 [Spathaspora sp. JA1]|nr:hypothetical protein JA1_001310 [Spathaspora sp. JA1]
MSKKEDLVTLLGDRTMYGSTQVEPAVDEIYYNKLEKDIERVSQYINQADVAIKHLSQFEQQASIEEKIIAMYDSYERVTYIPDKNDTISTAATSSILDELISRNTAELEKKVDIDEVEQLTQEYKDILEVLEQDKQKKQEKIDVLTKKIDKFKFKPTIKTEIIKANELHKQLERMVKRVSTKYLALSSDASLDKAQLNHHLKSTTKLIDQLLLGDWVEPEYNTHNKFFIDTLVKNDVLLLNRTDNSVEVKLRGFDIE